MGAEAECCDEYVCVCVCLPASISWELHAQSLPIFLRMLPMAMVRSSSGSVMKAQAEGGVPNYRTDLVQITPCVYDSREKI